LNYPVWGIFILFRLQRLLFLAKAEFKGMFGLADKVGPVVVVWQNFVHSSRHVVSPQNGSYWQFPGFL